MSIKKRRICHLTSAHPQYDIRIFHKECSSLAEYFDVHLVVVNGNTETINNVNIHSVDLPINSRIQRFTKAVNAVFIKAKEINAEIYHLHDPELLRIANKLKKLGAKVIYDAHEDLPRQIQSKPYLNKLSANLLSYGIEIYENYVISSLDVVVAATPYIAARFEKIAPFSIAINNYPLKDEIDLPSEEHQNFKLSKRICYIGNISKIRGIEYLIKRMEFIPDFQLDLAGNFSSVILEKELKYTKGWKNVTYHGFIDRTRSREIKKDALAGLVTFLNVPNHINAQPNKIFEYMAASLPVISSDFELWKEIIEKNQCGICVDPEKPEKIANAIQYLYDNPDEAKEMGKNGLKAVKEKYNWEIEKKKLITLYQNLLS